MQDINLQILGVLQEVLIELKEIKEEFIFLNKEGITFEEAPKYSGIGRDALKGVAKLGLIPTNKVGIKTVVSKSAIREFHRSGQSIDVDGGAVIVDKSRR